ncbi:GntR family transcriptional regulator [Streptomyces evansiae]|uniref:GntR family transcriptional regulator n=1 Tax=Streptomyces evansiae TaxID=3075535 RepID=UPI0028848F07|nr:GntR family transcriptional regulator [Streptomyces sp. DSM 41859]MDT0422201.1 GntR family transcriptional regulator [Streptomyces sp. DSM 41859]
MAKRYEKIADELREEIRSGHPAPGERLPAETALAEKYRVSVPTMRQAMGVLQAEGLVERIHGRGTFVRKERTRNHRSNERHQWEKDRARHPEETRAETGSTEHDTGLELSDLVFHAAYEEIEADDDLAAVFGVKAGTRLIERRYRTRRRTENAPFSLISSYLVRDVVSANPDLLDAANEPWPGGTQNQLYTVGIELGSVEEQVTARPPTVEEAEELDLTPGVSVLVLRKTSRATDGRVAEFSRVILPGDRTELTFVTPLRKW